MRIIVVGASGNIGKEIVNLLSIDHEIVSVGLKSGDYQCDYTSHDSIRNLYNEIGSFDALISVVGNDAIFKSYLSLKNADYEYGFERKFLGQINLVRIGIDYINENGVFILTSGFLSRYPNMYSIGLGPLNAAVDTFVQNVSPLLPKGIRINVVSPAPVVFDNEGRKGVVTAIETAKYYKESLDDNNSGRVLRAWGGLLVSPE